MYSQITSTHSPHRKIHFPGSEGDRKNRGRWRTRSRPSTVSVRRWTPSVKMKEWRRWTKDNRSWVSTPYQINTRVLPFLYPKLLEYRRGRCTHCVKRVLWVIYVNHKNNDLQVTFIIYFLHYISRSDVISPESFLHCLWRFTLHFLLNLNKTHRGLLFWPSSVTYSVKR